MRTALLFLLVLLPACAGSPEPERDLEPYVERGGAAMVALQQRLLETLTTALEEGGPVGAVEVCREIALEITDDVAESQGIALGRTSHRLRNPDNAPPEWARPYVEASAGKKVEAVEPHVVDLGDRVGVLRPIGTLGMCTQCHGTELDPELSAKVAELYPEDRATGFEVGDLRGWMWIEVPRR